MEDDAGTIRTRLATMRLIAPGLMEQRIHPGTVLDPEGLRETREVRERLCAEPCAVLSIIPESVRIDLAISESDHFRSERSRSTITALALVAHSDMMETVSKAYFTFFPQGFRIKVFNDERAARKWLQVQMEEVAQERKAPPDR